MEQLGQVHFARKTLVPTLILRNSPKLSHQCFVAALQLATGVRFPHGSRLLFRQDLRLGGMLTRPRSFPGRDTISCPYNSLYVSLSLCFAYWVYLGGGRGRCCGGQGQLAERQLAFKAAALCLALSELLWGLWKKHCQVRKSGVMIALAFSVVFTHGPCGLLIVQLFFVWSLMKSIFIFAVWTWILIIRKIIAEKNVEFPGQKFNVALLTLFSGRVESLLHE